jgi:hypothetical protein
MPSAVKAQGVDRPASNSSIPAWRSIECKKPRAPGRKAPALSFALGAMPGLLIITMVYACNRRPGRSFCCGKQAHARVDFHFLLCFCETGLGFPYFNFDMACGLLKN